MKNSIWIFLAWIALVCACSDDKGSGRVIPEGETQVDMNLIASGISVRGTNNNDQSIREITLLVFNGSGENATFHYRRPAWRKTEGSNVFTTNLITGSDLTIYFVANANDFIDGLDESVLQEGNTWSAIKEHLILTEPENLGTNMSAYGLPMWGMKEDVKILESEISTHLNTIELIRSVASVDIQIATKNFSLEEGYVVFAANKGYLPYDPDENGMDNETGILRATKPWSPAGFDTATDIKYKVENNETSIEDIFYIYENSTSLTPTGVNHPTKVVLKGKWNGGAGNSTYYPLSLRTLKGTDYVKKQVIRNNKYTIIITNVNGDGYGSLKDAKDADDVNVDFDVINWDKNNEGNIHVDGPKYIYVASYYAKMSRGKDDVTDIILKTNFDLNQLKMKFDSDSDYTEGLSLDTHSRFKVDIKTDQGNDGSKYDCFRFTNKLGYDKDATDNPAEVEVEIGRIKFTFKIEQFDKDPSDWLEGPGIGADLE